MTILALIACLAVGTTGCGKSDPESKPKGTVIYGEGANGAPGEAGASGAGSGMTHEELVAKAKADKQKLVDEYKQQASSQIKNIQCPNTGKAKEVYSIGPGCDAAESLIKGGASEWPTLPGYNKKVGRKFTCMLARKTPGVKTITCRSTSGVVKFNYPTQ